MSTSVALKLSITFNAPSTNTLPLALISPEIVATPSTSSVASTKLPVGRALGVALNPVSCSNLLPLSDSDEEIEATLLSRSESFPAIISSPSI